MSEGPAAETIGQRLRRLRLERRLSQRELSSPGVSYAYISRIEAGTRQPSVKAVRKLAAKLGVTADYLETGRDVRDVELRELRLADAELALRFGQNGPTVVAQLRELLDDAVEGGDAASATRARIALGLAAAEQGRPTEAIELLEQVLEGGVLATKRPDVYTTLGRAYASAGMPQRAVDLIEGCLRDLERETPDDIASRVRFSTYLSYALTDVGEPGRAHAVLTEALDQASTLADPYTRIRLYWGLARLLGYEHRAQAALEYYRRAIALLEATEDTVHLARANVGYAWTLLSAGSAEEAGEPLRVAEQLLGPSPTPQDLALLRTEQAKRAAALGEPGEAVAFAQEALAALGDSDPLEQGSALVALGDGQRLKGEMGAAEESFRRAVAAFERAGRTQETAQAYRAWGRLLRETGREGEALDVLEKAAEAAVRSPAGLRA